MLKTARFRSQNLNRFSFKLVIVNFVMQGPSMCLGVSVDEHQTWKHHISVICKQLSKSVGIIFRSRFYLSLKTKLTLYFALIYPYITDCNSTWSSTYVYLQKRAVRAIANSDYRAHSAPLFAKFGTLDIFQVNSFQIAKFMFYYQNQLLPPMFLKLFQF